MIYTIVALLAVDFLQGALAATWGYDDKHGPATWPGTCKTGTRQSPIDIRAADVDFTLMPTLHFIGYDHAGDVEVANNGHSVVVSGFEKWTNVPMVTGGQLKTRYKLVQFHFHWSNVLTKGSEHTLSGLSYPAELHLVHVREGLSLHDALKEGDGLAVIGVFFGVGNAPEPLSLLAGHFTRVLRPGNMSTLDRFRPRNVLPEQTNAFYKYDGSLTTPGCDEAVQWYVLAEPVSITLPQLDALRFVENSLGQAHASNYRPVQALNGRRVLFRPAQQDKERICSGAVEVVTALLLLMPPLLLGLE